MSKFIQLQSQRHPHLWSTGIDFVIDSTMPTLING